MADAQRVSRQGPVERAERTRDAVVLAFPTHAVCRAARRREMLARRRRTIAVVLVAASLGAGTWAVSRPGPSPASRAGAPARVIVGTGDTVWDLAERFAAPGTDKRSYVDALLRDNRVAVAGLRPGQRLVLPQSAEGGRFLSGNP